MLSEATTGFLSELRQCLGLLTRLPVATTGGNAPDMARACRWFPLVGAIVGAISAIALVVGSAIGLNDLAAILFALGAGVVLTGALHEDGLADVADGFGGGADRDAKLAIMRDSRIGTYGVLALVFTVALKAAMLLALMNVSAGSAAAAIIVAASGSRLAPVLLMALMEPARRDGMAVAAGRPTGDSVRIAAGLAIASLLLLPDLSAILATIVVVPLIAAAVGAMASRQVGGQTGDVLGASQQMAELGVYLALVLVAA